MGSTALDASGRLVAGGLALELAAEDLELELAGWRVTCWAVGCVALASRCWVAASSVAFVVLI